MKSRRNASSSGVPYVLSRWMTTRLGRAIAVAGLVYGIRRGRCGIDDGIRGLNFRRQLAGFDQAAERRHFDGFRPELDVRQAKAAADDPTVAKELLDLMGVR